MRSLILVILSALLLAGLFVGYWMAQSAPHGGGVESTKNQPEVTWPTNKDPNRLGAIRPGQVVSVKKYDDRGELISEFNGDRFIPPQGWNDRCHQSGRAVFSGQSPAH